MEVTEKKATHANRYLAGGVLVSVGASVCCIGPFILLATGISGAWISQLMILEPYQPIFVLIVLCMFAVAGWKIFRPVNEAAVSDGCPMAQVRWQQKATFFLTGALASILLTSVYWIVWIDQF